MWVILVKLITHILLPDIERTQHTHMPRLEGSIGQDPASAAMLARWSTTQA